MIQYLIPICLLLLMILCTALVVICLVISRTSKLRGTPQSITTAQWVTLCLNATVIYGTTFWYFLTH